MLWASGLRQGYVGCLGDLMINFDRFNLIRESRRQESVGMGEQCVGSGTDNNSPDAACASYPCLHGGLCRNGWTRFVCDCSFTEFRGGICEIRECSLKA